MNLTYLTTEELSVRMKYEVTSIRTSLLGTVFIEGRHYIKPFGLRKILFIWEHIEEDMHQFSQARQPQANQGVCYG